MVNLRTRTIYAGEEIVSVVMKDIKWVDVREMRDLALTDSDWRFMSDQSPSQEWVDYRQFLRDLPQNHFDETDEVSQGANAAADTWNDYAKPEGAL